ncbi:MAG: class I SAM-dependent methyltransferase [Planctomycetes bacterium]|nr:class I SAM-dependent methyltransferase [Planctomycetota bacterium]
MMNQFLRGMMQAVSESFHLPEPILEIGSLQVDDQSELINLRSLFPNTDYTGVDFRAGPGVDCVASVEALPHEDASVGTVIALSTFEHVQKFWLGFKEVKRVLRPDGVFVVASPFYFHVHAYPHDYWRFTPEALDFLLDEYPLRLLGSHGPARRMANVWGIAFNEKSRLPTDSDLKRYSDLMKAYARQPLPWHRRLRYQVGSLLCGRRPFAPHLEREKWSIERRGQAA